MNHNSGFSPFFANYAFQPQALIDLALVPDLKRVHKKVKDFISDLQEVHKIGGTEFAWVNDKV